MLERIADLPEGVVGVRAVGTVTKADYEQVIEPIFAEARQAGTKLRFLYEFGPDFERFSGDGALEDARMGLSSLRLFEGIALVTDVSWLRQSVEFMAWLMPCPVRVFDDATLDEAANWLADLPEGSTLEHRMLSDVGVLVVEPKGPLRAADFDELALVADPWIAAHGEIHGLVIHARAFPGWQNLGGLIRHIQFVQGHHRKIRKVAFAADSKLAEVAPKLAEHFVAAEVRSFGYDELQQAITWAGEDSPHAERSQAAE